MAALLGDRLDWARRQSFVGRAAEKELFQSAPGATDPTFQVLHVFGPGGVGKTGLLRELVHLCQQAGTPAVYVDGRDVEPSPDSFLDALRARLGLGAGEAVVSHLGAGQGRQ